MSKKHFFILIFLFALVFKNYAQDSLDIKIGQMIMTGLIDYNQNPDDNALINAIKEYKIGGVIFFEKDLSPSNTMEELKKTTDAMQKASKIPLFIAIDEEGGKVNRLKSKYGFPPTVSAQYLGNLNNEDSTFYYASQIAKNLKKHGFNVNFAPCVDVNINPKNPVISGKERSFSSDYKIVTNQARVFIKAHDLNDILTVIKHFPGHGSSTNDTHLGMADVTNTWKKEELMPYEILLNEKTAKAVMTSHIVNKNLDRKKLPSTLSKETINDLLRKNMNFNGIIFTDDMHMKAITEYYGFDEAVVLAINAGVDVMIFSNNISADARTKGGEIHAIIKNKVKSGEISEARINESFRRIIKTKKSFGLFLGGNKLNEIKRK